MFRKALAGAAIGAAFIALLGTSPAAKAAPINYADTALGASFVTASSINSVVTSGLAEPNAQQKEQDDILTDSPTQWLTNGETGYIFANGDNNQSIRIDLGQVRQVSSIGALFGTVSADDREVVGPFSVKTSTDGVNFFDWGSPVTIDGSTPVPTLITLASSNVRFIAFFFGPTGPDYGGDGSRVSRVFANAVTPIPGSALMFLTAGGVMAGMAVRRRKLQARAA